MYISVRFTLVVRRRVSSRRRRVTSRTRKIRTDVKRKKRSEPHTLSDKSKNTKSKTKHYVRHRRGVLKNNRAVRTTNGQMYVFTRARRKNSRFTIYAPSSVLRPGRTANQTTRYPVDPAAAAVFRAFCPPSPGPMMRAFPVTRPIVFENGSVTRAAGDGWVSVGDMAIIYKSLVISGKLCAPSRRTKMPFRR